MATATEELEGVESGDEDREPITLLLAGKPTPNRAAKKKGGKRK